MAAKPEPMTSKARQSSVPEPLKDKWIRNRVITLKEAKQDIGSAVEWLKNAVTNWHHFKLIKLSNTDIIDLIDEAFEDVKK